MHRGGAVVYMCPIFLADDYSTGILLFCMVFGWDHRHRVVAMVETMAGAGADSSCDSSVYSVWTPHAPRQPNPRSNLEAEPSAGAHNAGMRNDTAITKKRSSLGSRYRDGAPK